MAKNNIINHLRTAKMARRKELAMLSFPEKILVLVRLQKLADSINKITGRHRVAVWKI